MTERTLSPEELAAAIRDSAGWPYQPANGTEGMIFMDAWCFGCVRDSPDDHCLIIAATMSLRPDDPGGLALMDQRQVSPIPAVGALGYFQWCQSGAHPESLPWMRAWPGEHRRAGKEASENVLAELPLFGTDHG
jgi:hypothetical protein